MTVRYATNSTAPAPSDYTRHLGDAHLQPGETTKTVTVAVAGDTVVEPNETFKVQLSRPTNARCGDFTGVVTIVNDD